MSKLEELVEAVLKWRELDESEPIYPSSNACNEALLKVALLADDIKVERKRLLT